MVRCTKATRSNHCRTQLRVVADVLGGLAHLRPDRRDHRCCRRRPDYVEPRVALDGGVDGMDVERRVTVDGAPPWLVPGGHLLVEWACQASSLAERFTSNGLVTRVAGSGRLSATVVIGAKTRRSVVGGSHGRPGTHRGR